MANRYEIFDNDKIQLKTRKHVAELSMALAFSLFVSICALLVEPTHTLPRFFGFAIAAFWMVPSLWMINRLLTLRSVMWCIKLSEQNIVGYDYARRQCSFDWTQVNTINLTDTGLIVTAYTEEIINITESFPEFNRLVNNILDQAQYYSLPIQVDGIDVTDLDIQVLNPYSQI